LMQAGDDVLDSYRNSADPDPANFDWARARQCYTRVLDLDSRNVEARGKRALCDGYLQIGHGPAGNAAAEASFAEAARLLSRAPDPHLGLARVHVYGSRNLGRAM